MKMITIKANTREELSNWLTTGDNWKLPQTSGVRVQVNVRGEICSIHNSAGLCRLLMISEITN